MRIELVLASLAAIAVAAPIDTSNNGDSAYVKYAPYKTYTPYRSYGQYKRAAEEKTAAMNGNEPIMKRDGAEEMKRDKQGYGDYSPYASYGPYHGSVDAEGAKTQNDNEKRMEQPDNSHYKKYSGYTPYASYEPYPRAAEAEAAKLQKGKRDMLMKDKDFGIESKRGMEHPDAAEMSGSAESRADGKLPNNWYGKYDPYKDYGKYRNYDEYKG